MAACCLIRSLVITRNVLDITLPVARFLQAECNDIQNGMHQIQTLKKLCSTLRIEVNEFHQKCYSEAERPS